MRTSNTWTVLLFLTLFASLRCLRLSSFYRPFVRARNKPYIMSITEEKRVSFTKQLRDLRDSDAKEIAFSPLLTSDERKFVHKISQDFGLKSKSTGKADARFITVMKKNANSQKVAGIAPILWTPQHDTLQGLADPCFAAATKKFLFNDYRVRESGSKSNAPIHARLTGQVVETYAEAQKQRIGNSNYHSIQKKRSALPASHYRQAVCNLLKEHQIVLISGETGCGKSTQVPQFLLDDETIGPTCRMAITQPRRISAVAVAERIASERSETVGTTVGYSIRLDSEKSARTQVTFMTAGVLLRKVRSDPLLSEYTHIIVDEAHERDRFTEFMQIILRDICAKRADLKVILMSATMHTDKIRAYYGDIPQLNVGGSVFPVKEFFLEHVLKFTHHLSEEKGRHALLNGSVVHNASTGGASTVKATGGKSSSGKRPEKTHASEADSPHTPSKHPSASQTLPNSLARLGKQALRATQYHCALCGEGPFESPEELGTHSASCYPGASAAGPKSARKNGAEPTAEGGLSRLDSLAASINAIRMGKDGSGLKAHTHVVDAGMSVSEKNETTEQGESSAVPEDLEGTDETDPTETDEVEVQFPTHSSAAVDVDAGELVSGIDNADDALTKALLSDYQSRWDDSQVDLELIMSLLEYVFSSAFVDQGKQGSVLVFLPGWDEIATLHRMLSANYAFSDPHRFQLLQLHSGIPRAEQDRVFHALRPGQHKIILSTNIAETSITIDDVTVVINAGRAKENTYDPHTKLAYLQTTWVSQASARQRRGRAGRTQSGVCFHLYSSFRSQHLSAFQDSELLRIPLEEIVLQAKSLGVAPGEGDAADSVTSFLLRAMDPPHQLSVRNAVSALQSINCLDEHEQMTTVGAAVSQLPLSPRIGRMILLACLLGCGPAAVTTAACMGYRDPFVMPMNDGQRAQCNQAKARLGGEQVHSDQVVAQRALEAFTHVLKRSGMSQARRFCEDNFLSLTTMNFIEEVVTQLNHIMREVNVLPSQARAMRNNGNAALLQAVVSAGLYPDVGVRREGAIIFTTERACKAKIHGASVNARVPTYRKKCVKPVEIVGFQDLVASAETSANGPTYIGGANLVMLGTTPLSVFTLLLTCGRLEEISTGEENEELKSEHHVEVEADGWFSLQMHRDHFVLLTQARHLLATALVSFLRSPLKPLDVAVSKGIERIADVMAHEQQNCTSFR